MWAEAIQLTMVRALLAALISVAIALAPMGGAWGMLPSHFDSEVVRAPLLLKIAGNAAANAKSDCASMMDGTTGADPSCCAKDPACPPEFCIAKCFHVVTICVFLSASLVLASSRLAVSDHMRPPDWSSRPPPPPPRA